MMQSYIFISAIANSNLKDSLLGIYTRDENISEENIKKMLEKEGLEQVRFGDLEVNWVLA